MKEFLKDHSVENSEVIPGKNFKRFSELIPSILNYSLTVFHNKSMEIYMTFLKRILGEISRKAQEEYLEKTQGFPKETLIGFRSPNL